MRRYDDYIETNVQWLGKQPINWEIVRGKDLFFEKSKKGYPNLPLLAASQKQGVVLKEMLESRSMEALKDFENFKKVDIYDFVISLRSFQGGIETAYYNGIISPAYTVFNFRTKNNFSRFFTHIFKSVNFIKFLQNSITGIRDGQSIKFKEIQNTFFALPSFHEQQAIANYLDAKTQAIDKKVSLLEQKIETYKKLKRTLINQTITKGLNKNAPLKDSGIAWIGQIPQHWEVKRFKDVLLKNDGGVWGEFVDDGTIVLRSTEVDIDGKWKIDNPAICKLTSKEIKSSLLEKGDLLITKSSGSDLHIGKTAFVDDYVAGLQCCYSNFMQRLRINTKNYSKYYFLVLNSEISKLQYLYNTKSTTGLGNLSSEIFNLLLTVVPPKSEQEEIAKYLDHKTATIDAIVGNISKQIETLKQLRKTLINDVVTGKIKVIE